MTATGDGIDTVTPMRTFAVIVTAMLTKHDHVSFASVPSSIIINKDHCYSSLVGMSHSIHDQEQWILITWAYLSALQYYHVYNTICNKIK